MIRKIYYPDTTVGGAGASQGQNQQQPITIKSKEGQVAKAVKDINIFSSYESVTCKSGDGTVSYHEMNNSSKKGASIFSEGGSKLKNLLEGMFENPQIKDGKNQPNPNDYLSKFNTTMAKFSVKVGSIRLKITETDDDAGKARMQQREEAASKSLDSKAEIAAQKEVDSVSAQLEDAYRKAMAEVMKEPEEVKSPPATTVDNTEGAEDDGHKLDEHYESPLTYTDGEPIRDAKSNEVLTKTVVKENSTTVPASWDSNIDGHVKYDEVDASTFKYSGTSDFGLAKGQFADFIEQTADYNINDKFNEYIKDFDAKVGVKTVKDSEDVVKVRKDLDTKAKRLVNEFNTKISNKVQQEKFDAINDAIKDDSTGEGFNQYLKDIEEELKADDNNIVEDNGTISTDDAAFTAAVKEKEKQATTEQASGEVSSSSGPSTPSEGSDLYDILMDGLKTLMEPSDSGTASTSNEQNNTFKKSKFEKYRKAGLSSTLARYIADSSNGVKPIAYKNGKITKVRISSQDGQQQKTLSIEKLEEFIKNQKQAKKTEGPATA